MDRFNQTTNCNICNRDFETFNFKKHLNSKEHKFKLKHPNLEYEQGKPEHAIIKCKQCRHVYTCFYRFKYHFGKTKTNCSKVNLANLMDEIQVKPKSSTFEY